MEIRLEKDGQTALVETLGGELVSYRDRDGVEYIWCGDKAYWGGRNPLLFPIVGAAKDGHLLVDGQSYAMAQHGFAQRREFRCVGQAADWCVLELTDDAETLAQYPFSFRLRVKQALTAEGFTTTFTVSNPGERTLPFCIGAHTAFNCPLHAGEQFKDYALVFDKKETAPTLLVEAPGYMSGQGEPWLKDSDTVPLDHAIFDRLDTLIFEGLRSQGVSLLHRETGCGLRVDYTGFPMVAFWTAPHKKGPYLCIEPWHGCTHGTHESGALEDKHHCILLSAGEEQSFRYTITTISTK